MRGIVQGLFDAADRFATRIAVSHRGEQLTYEQLCGHVIRLACRLDAAGVRSGDRVAIALNNSPEFIVAVYASMLVGAIAVPLDAGARSAEFSYWLRHCDPRLIIANLDNIDMEAALKNMPGAQSWLSAPDLANSLDTPRGDVIKAQYLRTRLATDAQNESGLMLYTSGSTGRPKGVMLGGMNLASNADAIVEYLGLTSSDSSVVVLPFHYSYGSSVLHTHLRVGAHLRLCDNFAFPHLVVEALARTRASGFAGVASTFELLLARVDLSRYDLSELRYVTQAGGPMSAVLQARLRRALPHCQLFRMYGQTEAAARLTYLPPADLDRKPGSVGIPIARTRLQIRNDAGDVLGSEARGHIWAQGPGIMAGYWRDRAGTAAVLQDGWLNTGDMGYLDEDGYLYLVGRRTDMIKVGAHRVHPEEVEAVIAGMPKVQEVAAFGIEDPLLGQAVKVLVVAPGAGLDSQAVKNYCKCRMAGHKVPKVVRFVDALPKTASGKIRRRWLADHEEEL